MGSNKNKLHIPGYDQCECGAYIGPGEVMCSDCIEKADSPENVLGSILAWGEIPEDEEFDGDFI